MKTLSIAILSLLTMFISTNMTYAHSLQNDEILGVVLHIDPADDPIIGDEAVLFFEFKSKSGEFEPRDCECTINIDLENESIYSGPLFERQHITNEFGFTNAVIQYIFNKPGDYLVTINGSAINEADYEDFEFSYDVPVYRTSAGSRSLPLGLIAAVLFGIAGSFGLFYSKKFK